MTHATNTVLGDYGEGVTKSAYISVTSAVTEVSRRNTRLHRLGLGRHEEYRTAEPAGVD